MFRDDAFIAHFFDRDPTPRGLMGAEKQVWFAASIRGLTLLSE